MRGLRSRPRKEVEAPPGGAQVHLPFSVVEQLSHRAQTPPGLSLRCAGVHTWGKRAGLFSNMELLWDIHKIGNNWSTVHIPVSLGPGWSARKLVSYPAIIFCQVQPKLLLLKIALLCLPFLLSSCDSSEILTRCKTLFGWITGKLLIFDPIWHFHPDQWNHVTLLCNVHHLLKVRSLPSDIKISTWTKIFHPIGYPIPSQCQLNP